jgi:predicted metalloprotease
MDRVFQLGNTFLYLVVAHEWGHAIQARLASNLVSQAKELQADCLAGAVLYGAAADGRLKWENGDTQELARDLTNVADQYPWTKSSDHGNPQQRIDKFSAGRGGPKACLTR